MDIVIVSGGYDPPHRGHVQLFWEASKYGNVCVCLNSDEWLVRKKGKAFMTWDERSYIIASLHPVFEVYAMDDGDGTACDGIIQVVNRYQNLTKNASDLRFYFANGGDRKNDNVPEVDLCNRLGVELLWNIGGEKAQSSSDLLQSWVDFKNSQKTS